MFRRILIHTLLIIGAVVGVAVVGLCIRDAYLTSSERRKSCQENLQAIAKAKAMWAYDYRVSTNDTPTWSDLLGTKGDSPPNYDDRPTFKDLYGGVAYLRSGQPKCPSGGQYLFGRVGEMPRCTVRSHRNATGVPIIIIQPELKPRS